MTWTPQWSIKDLPQGSLSRTATMQVRTVWDSDAHAAQVAGECVFISGPISLPRLALMMTTNPQLIFAPYLKSIQNPATLGAFDASATKYPAKWYVKRKDGSKAKQGGTFVNWLMETGYYSESQQSVTQTGPLSNTSITAASWAAHHVKDAVAQITQKNALAANAGKHPWRGLWYDSNDTFSADATSGFWTGTNPGWDPHTLAAYTKPNFVAMAHWIGDMSQNLTTAGTVNPERLWTAANGLRSISIADHYDMAMAEGWMVSGGLGGALIRSAGAHEADLQLALDCQLRGCVAEILEWGLAADTLAQVQTKRRFTAAANLIVNRGLITHEFSSQKTNPAEDETAKDPELYALDLGLPLTGHSPNVVAGAWTTGHRVPVGVSNGQAAVTGLYGRLYDGGAVLQNITAAAINYKADRTYTSVPKLGGGTASYSAGGTVSVPSGDTVFLTHAGGSGGSVPSNTILPELLGTPREGQAIKVSLGSYTGSPAPIITDQVQVSASGTASWSDISGATGAAYTIPFGTSGTPSVYASDDYSGVTSYVATSTTHVYNRTTAGTATVSGHLQALITAAAADLTFTPPSETFNLPLGSQVVGPNATQGVVRIEYDSGSGPNAGTNLIVLDAVVTFASNVRLEIDTGVCLQDGTGSTTGMFTTNTKNNWSITRGDPTLNGGFYTIDCSYAPTNLKSRLTHCQNSSNFMVEWVQSIQTPYTSTAATAVLPFHPPSGTVTGDVFTKHPRNFIYRHHENTGSESGWGPNQISGAANGYITAISSVGGTGLRFETDGLGTSTNGLSNILAVGPFYLEHGNYACTMTAHNGNSNAVVVTGIYGYQNYGGCFVGSMTGTENGLPRGVFTNSSMTGGCIVGAATGAENPVTPNGTGNASASAVWDNAAGAVPVTGIGRTGVFTKNTAPFPGGSTSVACSSTITAQAQATAQTTGTVPPSWSVADAGGTWVTLQGADADFDESGGRGRVSHSAANTGKMIGLNINQADADAVVTTNFPGTATVGNMQSSLALRFVDTSNYMRLNVVLSATTGHASVVPEKVVAATATALGAAKDLGTYSAGADIKLRLRLEADNVKGKAWLGAGTEPAPWDWDVTDTSLSTPGYVMLRSFRATANTNTSPQTRFDNLVVSSNVGTVTGYVGEFLRTNETATNSAGSVTVASGASGAIAVGLVTDPVWSLFPSIGGTPVEGGTLTASPGTVAAGGIVTLAYQWETSTTKAPGSASDISAQTAVTHSPAAGTTGAYRRVRVSATAGGVTTQQWSQWVGPITVGDVPPSATTPPSIAGTTVAGDPLTLTQGVWAGVPQPGLVDQWQRSTDSGVTYTDIVGETGLTYLLQSGDVGSYIRVTETGTNRAASNISYTTPVGVVSLPADFPQLQISVTLE